MISSMLTSFCVISTLFLVTSCTPTVRQQSTDTTIYFGADDRVELYLNGVLIGNTLRTNEIMEVMRTLSEGDVVAMAATNFVGRAGVSIAWVDNNRNWISSAVSRGFRAVPAYRTGGNGWAAPSINDCSWPEVVPSDSDVLNGIPSEAMARPVWSKESATTIYVRFTVGIDPCARREIFYSADDMAEIFVNGISLGSVDGFQELASVVTNLYEGDVVAVRATNTLRRYGCVIAWLNGDDWISTGNSQNFRAILATGSENWNLPSFNACNWPVAVPGTSDTPSTFPSAPNANPIWSAGVIGENVDVYIRYKVGGEQC